jgi:alanyl-tRNA synthetase
MGDLVAKVDVGARDATVRNHSATHLLHAALKTVLGPHVQQQGSRVGPDALRFDFTHPKGVSAEELAQVELLVNEQILANLDVAITEQGLAEAKAAGAVALFGEKYGDRVRTIKMGQFSFELCGGTHARATGQIGLFTVTSESSIASGVRRIEAVTGLKALERVRQREVLITEMSRTLKGKPEELPTKVDELSEKVKSYEKELKAMRTEQVNQRIQEMIEKDTTDMGGVRALVKKLETAAFPRSTHQLVMDSLAGKLDKGVAFLTQVEDGTLSLIAVVGAGARDRVKAGDLVKELSVLAEGKGGGRPDRAQAGSKHPEKEPLVLAEAQKLIKKLLEQRA